MNNACRLSTIRTNKVDLTPTRTKGNHTNNLKDANENNIENNVTLEGHAMDDILDRITGIHAYETREHDNDEIHKEPLVY